MIGLVKKILAATIIAGTLGGTVAVTSAPAEAHTVPHFCNVYKQVIFTPFGPRVIFDRRCFWF